MRNNTNNFQELLHHYGWRAGDARNMFRTFSEKRLQCNKGNDVVLHICGPQNKNREFGDHLHVSRVKLTFCIKTVQVLQVGNFSENGTLYKTLDLPEHAMANGKTVESVKNCQLLVSAM